MKKKYSFVWMFAAASIITGTLQTASAQKADDGSVVQEDSFDETDKSAESGKSAFGGVFFGVGVSMHGNKAEVKSVERRIGCNENIGGGNAQVQEGAHGGRGVNNVQQMENARNADPIILVGILGQYGVDRIDFITGGTSQIGLDGADGMVPATDITAFGAFGSGSRKACGGSSSNFGGAFTLGYNAFPVDNFLLGGGITVDISGKKSKNYSDELYGKNGLGDATLESGGVVPTVFLRGGMYCECIKSLFFVKIGATLQNSEFKNNCGSVKLSGVVPTFGLGAQVGIGNGWSVLGEVDYICHTKKEGDLKGEDILIDFEPRVGEVGRYGGMFDARVARLTQSTKVKLENKGLAIRFSIVYNVKI